MNSEATYTTATQADDEDDLTTPPPAPRQGRFAQWEIWKWPLGLLGVWVGAMCLCKVQLDPHKLYSDMPAVYKITGVDYSLMKMGMTLASFFASFLLLAVLWHIRTIRRRRALFTDGIVASATVTFVGVIRAPSSNAFCVAVKWTYVSNGFECTGVTPRCELPNAVVGDKFWVLYEEKSPWFVRRWALFDKDGNLRSNDILPWEVETDLGTEHYRAQRQV